MDSSTDFKLGLQNCNFLFIENNFVQKSSAALPIDIEIIRKRPPPHQSKSALTFDSFIVL